MQGTEAFKDFNPGSNHRERRELNIKTNTTSHGISLNISEVWVIKNNGAIIKGPYYLADGELLIVPVDYGSWGAIVKSDVEILIDIWFTPR